MMLAEQGVDCVAMGLSNIPIVVETIATTSEQGPSIEEIKGERKSAGGKCYWSVVTGTSPISILIVLVIFGSILIVLVISLWF